MVSQLVGGYETNLYAVCVAFRWWYFGDDEDGRYLDTLVSSFQNKERIKFVTR